MNKVKITSPLIIIGMHRSGTSLLSFLMEQIGFFMGNKKDVNGEALFFLKLNDWILKENGASWDNPNPIKYLLNNNDLRKVYINYLRDLQSSRYTVNYLGFKKWIKYNSLYELDFNWGWKDPRNTFTLPLWSEIYPNAKILYIYRHGIDVSLSLLRRSSDRFLNEKELFIKRRTIGIEQKKEGFVDSARCLNLEDCFQLWIEYMSAAQKLIEIMPDRILPIKYEELLIYPDDIMNSIFKYLNINVGKYLLNNLIEYINQDHAYSYLNQNYSKLVTKENIKVLNKFGYTLKT